MHLPFVFSVGLTSNSQLPRRGCTVCAVLQMTATKPQGLLSLHLSRLQIKTIVMACRQTASCNVDPTAAGTNLHLLQCTCKPPVLLSKDLTSLTSMSMSRFSNLADTLSELARQSG